LGWTAVCIRRGAASGLRTQSIGRRSTSAEDVGQQPEYLSQQQWWAAACQVREHRRQQPSRDNPDVEGLLLQGVLDMSSTLSGSGFVTRGHINSCYVVRASPHFHTETTAPPEKEPFRPPVDGPPGPVNMDAGSRRAYVCTLSSLASRPLLEESSMRPSLMALPYSFQNRAYLPLASGSFGALSLSAVKVHLRQLGDIGAEWRCLVSF
jgi:hypothetical protein